jgi:hypothetical protein
MPDKGLDEPNDEYQHQRRQIKPAHDRQYAADRAKEWFSNAVKEITDHLNETITRVDDIEGDQPTHDRADNQRPDKKIQKRVNDFKRCGDYGTSGIHAAPWVGGIVDTAMLSVNAGRTQYMAIITQELASCFGLNLALKAVLGHGLSICER